MENKFEKSELNVGTVICYVLRHIWKTIIIAAVAAALVFVLVPDRYETKGIAATDFYFNFPDEWDDSKAVSSINTAAAIMRTSPLMDAVIEETGINMSPGELASSIINNRIDGSYAIHCEITMPSQELAGKAMTSLAEKFSEFINSSGNKFRCKMYSDITGDEYTNVQSPTKYAVAVFAIILIMGGFIKLISELFSRKIKNEQDAELYLERPVYTLLPDISRSDAEKVKNNSSTLDIALPKVYKKALDSIIARILGSRAKTVCFSSSLMNEDCSIIALRTAAEIAAGGRKTVFIDCGIKNSEVGALVNSEGSGLSDILSHGLDYTKCIKSMKGLDLITAGETEIPLINLSDKLSALVTELKEKYDMVIIASPAAAVSAEAAVAASCADSTILVCRHRYARLQTLCMAEDRLETCGGRVCGIIVSGVKRSRLYNSSAYYESLKSKYNS